jgi:hypothetical protein
MKLIKSVHTLHEYHVRLTFTNGEEKVVDLLPLLHGPVFDKVRQDLTYFGTLHVDEESGTICWDNGADIDPDVLYGSHQPAWKMADELADK